MTFHKPEKKDVITFFVKVIIFAVIVLLVLYILWKIKDMGYETTDTAINALQENNVFQIGKEKFIL